ncbi:MAG: hypothetical protein ACLFVQ_05340 [Chitinispirillaceae bacterium]
MGNPVTNNHLSSPINQSLIGGYPNNFSPFKNKEWEPSLNSVFLKVLYSGTLLEFSPERLHCFWSKHPLTFGGRTYRGQELLEFIWTNNTTLPLSYISEVVHSLETEVTGFGSSIDNFLEGILSRLNTGCFIPSSKIMQVSKQFFEGFIRSGDQHTYLLRCLQDVSRHFAPDTPHCLLNTQKVNGHTISTVLLIPDRLFQNRYPGLDPYVWVARMIKAAPVSLGLSPFESVRNLSDNRRIHEILINGEKAEMEGNQFTLNNEVYGRVVTFGDFCARHSLKLSHLGFDDCHVLEVDRDYYCLRRKRTVLHAGCIYGGPVYLYTVSHPRNASRQKGFLVKLIENSRKEKQLWRFLNTKHKELLREERVGLSFLFDSDEQTLSVNRKHLLRGVPARILSSMLRQYVEENCSQFTYGDFLRDREIVTEPTNPNLAIRFNRIATTLSRKAPQICLAKEGRGRLRLRMSCRVSYSER